MLFNWNIIIIHDAGIHCAISVQAHNIIYPISVPLPSFPTLPPSPIHLFYSTDLLSVIVILISALSIYLYRASIVAYLHVDIASFSQFPSSILPMPPLLPSSPSKSKTSAETIHSFGFSHILGSSIPFPIFTNILFFLRDFGKRARIYLAPFAQCYAYAGFCSAKS